MRAVSSSALTTATGGRAEGFNIIQITDDGGIYPDISGSNVVWADRPPGPYSDYEIYLWNGGTITNISNNSNTGDLSPAISGSKVVWTGYQGVYFPDYDLYLWEGGSTTQIINSPFPINDMRPRISGSNVVWRRSENNGSYEIYFWDGSFPVVPIQITNESTGANDSPDISGSNVVWEGVDVSDFEIYLWDGVTTAQLTDNDTRDRYPAISGSNVVWQGCDGGTGYECIGGDIEIYFWDGANTTQITNNGTADWYPAISGSNVVWQGCDGGDPNTCGGGDWEIYFWDGSFPIQITQITNNSTDDEDPAISGSNVVWECYQETTYGICMATPSAPPTVPALSIGGLLLTAGLIGLAGRRQLRQRGRC